MKLPCNVAAVLLFMTTVDSLKILPQPNAILKLIRGGSIQELNTFEVDCLVVGAGLTGLSSAFYIHKHGVDVCLADGADRLGGNLRSNNGIHYLVIRNNASGFSFEEGPNSFQPTIPLLRFFADLNISNELVLSDNSLPRYVFWKKKLHPIPMKFLQLITFSVISFVGKIRSLFGLFGWIKSKAGDDVSVAEYMTRHFGKEVCERLVDPFVSGVYAGDIRQLSMKAAFKKIYNFEVQSTNRGLWSGIRRVMRQRSEERKRDQENNKDLPAVPPGSLGTLRNGMESIARKVGAALEGNLLLLYKLVKIERAAEGAASYVVELLHDGEVQRVRAKALVLTTPAHVTARLLRELAPQCERLSSIPYPPVSVVVTAYPKEAFKAPMDGFGHLIPRSAGIRSLGSIWASTLFPGRTPPGYHMLSTFVGGAHDPAVASVSDQELVDIVHKDHQEILLKPGAPRPMILGVQRYAKSIPQFNKGHTELIESTQRAIRESCPGLIVGGNYVGGVSIGDCVQHGKEMADVAVRYLKSLDSHQ